MQNETGTKHEDEFFNVEEVHDFPQTHHFNEVSIPQPIPSRYLPSSQPIASLYELASFNSAFFLALAPRSFVS